MADLLFIEFSTEINEIESGLGENLVFIVQLASQL